MMFVPDIAGAVLVARGGRRGRAVRAAPPRPRRARAQQRPRGQVRGGWCVGLGFQFYRAPMRYTGKQNLYELVAN